MVGFTESMFIGILMLSKAGIGSEGTEYCNYGTPAPGQDENELAKLPCTGNYKVGPLNIDTSIKYHCKPIGSSKTIKGLGGTGIAIGSITWARALYVRQNVCTDDACRETCKAVRYYSFPVILASACLLASNAAGSS